MKTILTRFFALCMALALCFSMSFRGKPVFAQENSTTVTLTFEGEHKNKPGFAQCTITVTPGDNPPTSGYYLVYYTDGVQVLPNYDEVTAIPVNNGLPVTGSVKHGICFPKEAKGIAVFEHTTYYTTKKLDISQAVATAPIPLEKQVIDLGEPHFTFGTLSDTHMNYEQYSRGAYAKLEASMNFFAQKNMDIVVITGDVTGDRGEFPDLEAQYQKHIEIINNSSFDLNNVYEAAGNHGNTPADAQLLNQFLGNQKQQHPFENSPYYHVLFENPKKGNDNLFIFMAQELNSPGESAAYDNFSKEQMDWLEELLTQYAENTNIFLTIHSPFYKYGAGDIEKGTYTACITFKEEFTQTMRLKALLEQHQDVVVMSGHTHLSFYENANYSNVFGTFAHTVHIGSNSQPCGYGEKTELVKSYDGRRNVTTKYGSEGYTVEVYKDYIVYTGYNLSTGKIIPDALFMIPTKPYQEEAPTPYGDLNGDTKINAKDALQVLKISVGKTKADEQTQILADVNEDHAVNAKDALEILKYAVGKPGALDKFYKTKQE